MAKETYKWDLYLVFVYEKAGQKRFYPLAKVSWEVVWHVTFTWQAGEPKDVSLGPDRKVTVGPIEYHTDAEPQVLVGPTAKWANLGKRGAGYQ